MNKTICLKELYQYAEKDDLNEGLHGNSKIGKTYVKEIKKITSQISNEPGFYIWGRFDKNFLWHNIYIGQTGVTKTAGLKGRIEKELNSERALIWRTYLNEDELDKACLKFYRVKYSDYIKQWKRAYRRTGTTYVITISTKLKTNSEILQVESDLIETMNPIANLKRPKPNTGKYLAESIRVIQSFKEEINKIRKEPKLVYIQKQNLNSK